MLIPTATLLTLVIVAPEISGQMFPFSNLLHYFNTNTKLTGGGSGGGGGSVTGGGLRGILSGGHRLNDLKNASTSQNTTDNVATTKIKTDSTSFVAKSPIAATVSPKLTSPVEYNPPTTATEMTYKPFAFFPTELVTKPSLEQDHFSVTDEVPDQRYRVPAEKRHDYEPDKSPSSDYNAYVDAEEDYPAETPRSHVNENDRSDTFTRRNSYQTREPIYDDVSTEVYTTPEHVQHTRAPFDKHVKHTRAPFRNEPVQRTRAPLKNEQYQRTRAPSRDEHFQRTRTPLRDERVQQTRVPFGDENAQRTRAPFGDEQSSHTRAPFDDEQSPHTRAPFGNEQNPHTRAPFGDEQSPHTRAPFGDEQSLYTRAPFGDEQSHYTRAPFVDEQLPYTRAPFDDDQLQQTRAPFNDEPIQHTSAPFDYEWEIKPVPVEERFPDGRKKLKPQDQGQKQKQRPTEKDAEEEDLSREIFESFKKNQKPKPPPKNRNSPKRKPNDENSKLNSKSDFGVFEQPVYLNPFELQPQNNPFRVSNGHNNDGYMQINYVNPISTPNPFSTTAYSIIPYTQAHQDFTGLHPYDVSTKRLPTTAFDNTTPFKLDWNFFNGQQTPAKPMVVYNPHQSFTSAPFQVPIPSGNPGLNSFNGNGHSFNPPKSNVESIYQQENVPYASPTPPTRVLANIRPVYSTPQPPVALTTTSPPHADYPVTHVIKYSKESPFHFPFLDTEEPIIESLPAISFALNEHKKAQHLEKDDVVDYLTPPKLELAPHKPPKLKPKKKKLPSRRNKHYKSLSKETDPESRHIAGKGRNGPQALNQYPNQYGDYGREGDNFDAIVPQAWGQDPKKDEEETNSEEKSDEEKRPDEENEYDECAEGNCDYNDAEDEGNGGENEDEEEEEEGGAEGGEEEEGSEEEKEEKDVKIPLSKKKHAKTKDGREKPPAKFDFSKYFPQETRNKEEVEEEEEAQDETDIEESVKNQKYQLNPDENHKSPIKKTFSNSNPDSRENFIKSETDKREQFLRTRRPDSRGNILGGVDLKGSTVRLSDSRENNLGGATPKRDILREKSSSNHRSSAAENKVARNGSLADNRVKKSNTEEELDNQKQAFTPVPKFTDTADFDSGFTDDESSELEKAEEGEGGDGGGDRVEFQMHGQSGPDSYKFGFDTGKGDNRQFRYEEKENDGTVKGHYGYYDQHGKLHVVNYAAHPEHGFQAEPAT